MKMPKDSNFTITLAADDKPHTIPRLLRHAMKTLREDTIGCSIYIHQLQLENPYTSDTSDTRHSITCSYWVNTKSKIKMDADSIEYRKEYKIAKEIESIKLIPKEKKTGLQLLEYRLPQSDNQNDTILLLEELADYLEKDNIEDILDIILKDWLDDDAIEHPFVRVYYLN